ncbi:MAG: ECF transporter S component [Oscillospiraceae bacterium]|nr:ECF transporter S component [Oscillospiraceae bacterium]
MNDAIPRNRTLRLTLTGMFTAMTVILSLSIFSIPVPGGHLYFCDTVINVAAILLDPLSAFVVGGIGSFLGDFFFYPAPMFVSLVTHGLQAVVVCLISHRILRKRQALASGIGVTIGAIIMVIGYTLGRAYVYSTPEYSLIKLPFEIVQAGFGAIFAMIVCYPLRLRELYFKVIHP